MGTAEQYTAYSSVDDLPAMFRVKDLASFLGVNQNKAYEIVKRKDFPSIKIGNRIMIPREHFKNWLDREIEKGKNDF